MTATEPRPTTDADTVGSEPSGADALAALRRARTDRRRGRRDRFDDFYRAYVTGLCILAGFLAASGAVHDVALGPDGVAEVARRGPAVVGLLVASTFAAGLRSGSRGGPLAVEAADVHHLLLGPLRADVVLHAPARRQLVRTTGIAAAIGGGVGVLAAGRLPGHAAAWALSGATAGALAALAALVAAWAAHVGRVRRGAATAVAVTVVAVAVVEVVTGPLATPSTAVARIALAPLVTPGHAAAVGLVVLAGACAGAGVVVSRRRDVRPEDLAQRSRLVGALRFAAANRDLRTVVLLRRQLVQERSRTRPWSRLPPLPWPVVRRDLRALLRTPVSRLVRLVALVVAVAVAGIGVARGTTALVVVAAIGTFLAGLEVTEPLAEEIDRSPLLAGLPVVRGQVLAAHLVVPALTLAVVAVPVGAGAAIIGGGRWALGAVVGATASGTAVAGAAVAVLREERQLPGGASAADVLLPPEVAGMRLVQRALLPPALAGVGLAPLLLARSAASAGKVDPVAAAGRATVPVLLVVLLVVAWVRWGESWRDAVALAEQGGAA